MTDTRVLLITGGHPYEREPFLSMFSALEGIRFDEVIHPNAQARFVPASANVYDAMVFYDFGQTISPEAKTHLLAYLNHKPSKGAVFLHHSICNYREWPEYTNMVGGYWGHKPFEMNGKSYPASVPLVNQHVPVHVSDPDHPITRDIPDFELLDETYKHYYIANDVTPLLETDHPQSERLLGWTKTWGRARIVFLQPGHDHHTYENPHFRQVLARSIRWASGKI
jgi:type 1 glutamine amidotransferase